MGWQPVSLELTGWQPVPRQGTRFSLNLVFVETVVAGGFYCEGDAALRVGGGGVGFSSEEVGEAEGFAGDVAEGEGGGGLGVV